MKGTIHKPYKKFKGWIRENGLSYQEIADFLGVNLTTICNKINGKSDFTLSEIKALKEKYNLDSAIFFTDDVA